MNFEDIRLNEISQPQKRQILYDSTHLRYLLFSRLVMSNSRNTMDRSMTGFPVLHYLPELAQTHVRQVGDATQPSHPLLSSSPPAVSLSQHQGLS